MDKTLRHGIAQFCFMNKDKVVATFTIDNSQGIEEFRDYSVIGQLPVSMPSMERWVNGRNVLIDKKHAKAMMKALGIETATDFIDFTNCVSLFDSFWVKRADSRLKWKNVSLYRNDFSEYLAHFSMSSEITNTQSRKRHLSPEYNTSGSFDHCWVRYGDRIILLKAGSYGYANAGREPFSEVYANQLERALGITDYVEYHLQHFRRRLPRSSKVVDAVVTGCDIITDESVGMVDALSLGIVSYQQLIDYSRCISEEASEKIIYMLLFDCLSVNTDRHLRNVSMLIDNTTQQVLGPAPIYDNNMSFLPMYMPEYDDIHEYAKDLLTAEDSSFDELFTLCFTETCDREKMISILRAVEQEFHFQYIPFDETLFPESRMLVLESFIRERAGYFREHAMWLEEGMMLAK